MIGLSLLILIFEYRQIFYSLRSFYVVLQVTIEPDLTGAEIVESAKDFSLEDHTEAGMVVVAILSHGIDGIIEGIDGKPADEEEILNLFSDEQCKQLADKPKLFIFVHCR